MFLSSCRSGRNFLSGSKFSGLVADHSPPDGDGESAEDKPFPSVGEVAEVQTTAIEDRRGRGFERGEVLRGSRPALDGGGDRVAGVQRAVPDVRELAGAHRADEIGRATWRERG